MNIAFYEIPKIQQKIIKERYAAHKLRFFSGWIEDGHLPPADTEILSVHSHSRVTKDVIKAMPNLKYIITRTAGYDHIDLSASAKKGILVSNIPGQNSVAVAELTFGLILALARDLYEAIDEVKNGVFDDDFHIGHELEGKTIGILGTGAIGGRVARIAKGFGMEVIAWDLKKNNKLASQLGFKYVSFDSLLRRSDVITLHVPATKETRHLINKNTLGLMKAGSLLINTARGSLIDPAALLAALSDGKLAGAAMDVIEEEPAFAAGTVGKLPPVRRKVAQTVKKIISLPNVIVTPHMAHASEESVERIFAGTLEAIDGFIAGKPANIVS
jgi:D-lactate dehydrogenase